MKIHSLIMLSFSFVVAAEIVGCSGTKPVSLRSPAECPSTPVPAGQLTGSKLEGYRVCRGLWVTGKVWNISADSITMIDPGERTDSNGAVVLGGSFETGTYFGLSKSVSAIKARQAYDELWVNTYACDLDQGSPKVALRNCVPVQK